MANYLWNIFLITVINVTTFEIEHYKVYWLIYLNRMMMHGLANVRFWKYKYWFIIRERDCLVSNTQLWRNETFEDTPDEFKWHSLCSWEAFSQKCIETVAVLNLKKPTGHVMHQQFNIQQLYALPTLYLCVLYLSENKQRLVPLTA